MKKRVRKSRIWISVLLLFQILFCFAANFPQSKPKTESLPPTEEDTETILTMLLSDKTRNLHQWSAINQFHGLPSERVNAIEQTPDGIMWFATDSGLAKFDGRRVQSVSPENFSNRRILSLKTMPTGRLWIGTESGVFLFDNDRFQNIAATVGLPVKSLAISDQNEVFFEAAGVPKPAFRKIVQNTAGEFEMIELDERPAELKAALLQNPKIETVTAAAVDSDGNSWFGTRENGVFLFRGAEEISHYTLENTAGGLRSNELLSIFIDPENVIWFGTVKGISRFDPNSPLSDQFAVGTNSNFIRTIFQASDGKIYAGTQQGLFLSDSVGVWKMVVGFEKRKIFAISENEPGNLLLGTSRGLFFFPPLADSPLKNGLKSTDNAPAENEKLAPAGSIRAIRQFQNKTFAGVFGQGLAELENSVPVPLAATPKEALNITSLKSDADQLWIGTAENGVFSFDGRQFGMPSELEGLKNKAIWAIEGSAAESLWFGTEKGLYLLKNGTLTIVNTEFDVRALALSPDGNGVWCATEKNGLVRFAEDPVFGWISSRLDVEQGLPSQKVFSVFRQTDDTFLIGTTRGVVRYKTPKTKPLLVTTSILSRRIHAPEELKSRIDLEFPQNTLTVEVSAINSRTFPEQFQYAFILSDLQNRIIRKKFGKDPQFLMDNLGPGDYRVEIRAFDKNLLASEPLIFEFKVEKAPFPWITLALTVLLLLALIALLWAIWSQRKIFQKSSELRLANRELSAARMDLANEAERERRRISRDLHDQTLADLRHLQLLTDKIPESDALAETSGVLRHEIENVSHEIRRICEDLSPSVLENIGFSAALEWVLRNSLQSGDPAQNILFDFKCPENLDEELRLSHTEQIQIYRIVQEVLNNISRHSNAAKVILTVENSKNGFIELTIEDDGQGFDFDNFLQRDGRGLSNVKSRAKLIEADFAFGNAPQGGTVFKLRQNSSKSNDYSEF